MKTTILKMKEIDLLKLLLPSELSEYFEITQIENTVGSYVLHLAEKNVIPVQYKENKLQSKGFYEPIIIQDFPLRGKACYLHVKRRRWLDLDTGDIVIRDWDTVAKGTKLTNEFASFLKEFNR